MVSIKKQLISNTPFKNGVNNPVKFITIHQTGNTSRGANAQAHANLQSRGNSRNASWHYQVDDKEAIQSFSHKFQLWHSGDGQGSGNNESIAIEMCVNVDSDYNKAMSNLIDLIVHLIRTEPNIKNTNHVVTHKWWSGKDCPHYVFSGRNGWTYDNIIREVNKRLGVKKKTTKTRTKAQPNKSVDINKLVQETLQGKHGNGNKRKKLLGKYYNEVQRRINKLYGI